MKLIDSIQYSKTCNYAIVCIIDTIKRDVLYYVYDASGPPIFVGDLAGFVAYSESMTLEQARKKFVRFESEFLYRDKMEGWLEKNFPLSVPAINR